MNVGTPMLRLLPRSRSFVRHIVVLLLTFRCTPLCARLSVPDCQRSLPLLAVRQRILPQVHFSVNYSIIRN